MSKQVATVTKSIKAMVNIDVTINFLDNTPRVPMFLLLQNRMIPLEFLSPETAVCTFDTPRNLPFDMVIVDANNRIVKSGDICQYHINTDSDTSVSYTVYYHG